MSVAFTTFVNFTAEKNNATSIPSASPPKAEWRITSRLNGILRIRNQPIISNAKNPNRYTAMAMPPMSMDFATTEPVPQASTATPAPSRPAVAFRSTDSTVGGEATSVTAARYRRC